MIYRRAASLRRLAQPVTRVFFTVAGLASIVVCSIGCSKVPEWRTHSFTVIELSKTPDKVLMPRSLWEKIEHLLPEATAKQRATTISLPTAFESLKIYLLEKNKGILKHGDTAIKFGHGGGNIDLGDFVEDKNGSFSLVAEFMPEAKDAVTHVYFLSNGVLRKHDDETLGAGCDTYFDVTSAFAKAAAKEGLLVNTTDGRHVSALAGTYFFASVFDGTLHLASLVIRDSALRSLQCRL